MSDNEKIEKISEDDNPSKTIESAYDNNLETPLDNFSDDHDNDLEVKNESCEDTEDLLDGEADEENEIESERNGVELEGMENSESNGKLDEENFSNQQDDNEENILEAEEDSWEYEWEDEDENECEFFEIEEDEYKVQTFDGTFSINIVH